MKQMRHQRGGGMGNNRAHTITQKSDISSSHFSSQSPPEQQLSLPCQCFVPGLISQESQYHGPFLTNLTSQDKTLSQRFKQSQKYQSSCDIFKNYTVHNSQEHPHRLNQTARPKLRVITKSERVSSFTVDLKILRKILCKAKSGNNLRKEKVKDAFRPSASEAAKVDPSDDHEANEKKVGDSNVSIQAEKTTKEVAGRFKRNSASIKEELKLPGKDDNVSMVVMHFRGEKGECGLVKGKQDGSGEEQTKELVSEDVNVAMTVALEIKEKGRAEEREKMEIENKEEVLRLQTEADDLLSDVDRSDLSLEELATLRQLEAKLGSGHGQSQGQRAVLDAERESGMEKLQDIELAYLYRAFLSLFPYCYAYWRRYSDIERKEGNRSRGVAIFHRGLTGELPSVIGLVIKVEAMAGVKFKSYIILELFIVKELNRKELRFLTNQFRRVWAMPTKLFNKLWNNFIAHMRYHYPQDILQSGDFEGIRKLARWELSLTYRLDQVAGNIELLDDKLKADMMEILVASLVSKYEQEEQKVDEVCR